MGTEQEEEVVGEHEDQEQFDRHGHREQLREQAAAMNRVARTS